MVLWEAEGGQVGKEESRSGSLGGCLPLFWALQEGLPTALITDKHSWGAGGEGGVGYVPQASKEERKNPMGSPGIRAQGADCGR